MASAPEHDRVWDVSWVFPGTPGRELPEHVGDAVTDRAATVGVAVVEACEATSEIGGAGDLVVWRFTCRVPSNAQPADPRDRGHRDHRVWPVEPRDWPPLIAQLAASVAAVAERETGTGRIEVAFRADLTTLARAEDAVAQAYDADLADFARVLEGRRRSYMQSTGQRLPPRRIKAYPTAQGIAGYVVFYVGEWPYRLSCDPAAASLPRTGWRTVTVGMHLPDWPLPPAMTAGMDRPVPVLPVPVLSERERREVPWLLALDGKKIIDRRLETALPVVMYHLMFVTAPAQG